MENRPFLKQVKLFCVWLLKLFCVWRFEKANELPFFNEETNNSHVNLKIHQVSFRKGEKHSLALKFFAKFCNFIWKSIHYLFRMSSPLDYKLVEQSENSRSSSLQISEFLRFQATVTPNWSEETRSSFSHNRDQLLLDMITINFHLMNHGQPNVAKPTTFPWNTSVFYFMPHWRMTVVLRVKRIHFIVQQTCSNAPLLIAPLHKPYTQSDRCLLTDINCSLFATSSFILGRSAAQMTPGRS